jgi:TPR repeat protein
MPINFKAAAACFASAAEGGCVPAMHALAGALMRGEGTARDAARAAAWYARAARAGHLEAMYVYHTCLREATGVERDDAEALRWLSRAAEGGHGDAKTAILTWTWPPAVMVRSFSGQSAEQRRARALALEVLLEKGHGDAVAPPLCPSMASPKSPAAASLRSP